MTVWITLAHFRLIFLSAMVWAGLGCYRSHQPSSDAAVDASLERVDVGLDSAVLLSDAGDAGVPDMRSPPSCDEVGIAAMRPLESWQDTVTHRLVNLPGGDLALVGVESTGSPVNVIYQRFNAGLEPTTARVIAVNDSWTWAEPVFHEGQLSIAYGHAGMASSVLRPLTSEGVAGQPQPVSMFHPMLLQSGARGVFWVALTDGQIQAAHLDPVPFYRPVEIDVERFGSRTHALPFPDGSHLLAYTSETPGGIQSYVRKVSATGTLGRSMQMYDGVTQVRLAESAVPGHFLILSRRGDELDFQCLRYGFDRPDRTFNGYPGFSGSVSSASVMEHLMVIHQRESRLTLTDFGEVCLNPPMFIPPLPLPAELDVVRRVESVLDTPSGIVLALRLGEDGVPWLIRLGCL